MLVSCSSSQLQEKEMADHILETIPLTSLTAWISKFDPTNPIVFHGIRTMKYGVKINTTIHKDANNLPLHREICSISQSFEWGYGGSGPSQTSIAILYALYGMSQMQMVGGAWPILEKKVIKRLKCDEWYLTDMQITLILTGLATFEQLCPQYMDGYCLKKREVLTFCEYFLLIFRTFSGVNFHSYLSISEYHITKKSS